MVSRGPHFRMAGNAQIVRVGVLEVLPMES